MSTIKPLVLYVEIVLSSFLFLSSISPGQDKVEFSKSGLKVGGKPVLPMCGEFHYWRVDPSLWDDILGRLMKGCGLTMVASYIPWSVHEPRKGVFDFTGWTNPRANLEGFLKLVKKHGLYFFARSGPFCYGEIHGGGPPDYARMFGNRTEKFVELSKEWIKQVSRLWKRYSIRNGGPLVFIQVDNEILPNDVYFPRYLKKRYGKVDGLNSAWRSRFADFAGLLGDKKAMSGKYGWTNFLDLMRYRTMYFPGWYVSKIRDMFKEYGTDVPLMANNTFFSCQDWYSLQKQTDFVGVDYYGFYLLPGDSYYWDYLYLSLNNNISKFPWSPEFQCGSSMMGFGPTPSRHEKLVTFFALASGMRGMNYYMFVERERWEGYCPVTENGKIRPEWFAFKHFNKVLNEIDWVRMKRQCSIGLLWDMGNFWRYLYQGGRKFNIQPADYTDVGSTSYECAQEPLWAYVKTLVKSDTNFDMVDDRSDLSAYPVILYAEPRFLGSAYQKKLADYVRGGGRLIFLGSPPNRGLLGKPSAVLARELALPPEPGENADFRIDIAFGGKRANAYVFRTFNEGSWDKVLARTKTGKACAVEKKAGKGNVVLLGFEALDWRLFKRLGRFLDLPVQVQGDNPWIQTSLHRGPKGAVVIAINRNEKKESARIKIFPDLELGGNVRVEEMFTHNRLKMKADRSLEVDIPPKDVAVIYISPVGTDKKKKLGPEEELKRVFKGVGFIEH